MGRIIAWLRLIRLPNLLTVPGDVLAGFLLSGGSEFNQALASGIVVSFCIYTAGLISNDYFDIDEDKVERPERPLASGIVGRFPALAAFVSLFSAGLSLSLLSGVKSIAIISMALAALVLFYNAVGKRLGSGGPVILGVCRGLNVLLGWSAADGAHGGDIALVVAVLSVMFYAMAVSFAAKNETSGYISARILWLPEAVLATSLSLILALRFSLVTAVLGLFAVMHGALSVLSGVGERDETSLPAACLSPCDGRQAKLAAQAGAPSVIGGFIRQLILLQAVFCSAAAPEGLPVAAALCAAWLAFPLFARISYSS